MLRGSALKNGDKGKWSNLGTMMAQGAAACMFKNGVCVCVLIRMHICMCMYVCMYACMFVCMYFCMYLCMYVRTYVCICIGMYDVLCMYVCVYICVFWARRAR
jgi:hypothetical protein